MIGGVTAYTTETLLKGHTGNEKTTRNGTSYTERYTVYSIVVAYSIRIPRMDQGHSLSMDPATINWDIVFISCYKSGQNYP